MLSVNFGEVLHFLSLFLGHSEGKDERKELLESPPSLPPLSHFFLLQFYTLPEILFALNKSHRNLPPMYESWMPILAFSLFATIIFKQVARCYMGKALTLEEVTVLSLSLLLAIEYLWSNPLILSVNWNYLQGPFQLFKSLWICEVFTFQG